jgi:hypothetical protein
MFWELSRRGFCGRGRSRTHQTRSRVSTALKAARPAGDDALPRANISRVFQRRVVADHATQVAAATREAAAIEAFERVDRRVPPDPRGVAVVPRRPIESGTASPIRSIQAGECRAFAPPSSRWQRNIVRPPESWVRSSAPLERSNIDHANCPTFSSPVRPRGAESAWTVHRLGGVWRRTPARVPRSA